MKRTLRDVAETIATLKQELEEIAFLSSTSCFNHFLRSYHRLYSGSKELEGLHFVCDEYRNEIIDLHSKYLNAFPGLLKIPVPDELTNDD